MYQDVTSTFESFYTGTAPRLLRYAYGLTGNMAEAQDFTQEAYARAWARWKRVERYENPESWLRLVVSRLAVDRLRWLGVRHRRAYRETTEVAGPNEQMMTVVAALKRLPMPQRKALVLHYFLDMPVAEIAAETGCSVNTVKTWLARGRVNMAAELTDLPVAKQDLQGVRDKARRRRTRNVATTIAAFLATATAAAAAILAIPNAVPPTLHPDLIVPYVGQPPRNVLTAMVGQRAVGAWHSIDGRAYAAGIDLFSGEQAWPPIELGRFDDSLAILGSHGGVLIIAGVNDSMNADDFTLIGIDVVTGAIRWQRPPQAEGSPLVDLETRQNGTQAAAAGVLPITAGTSVSGIDFRTGQPVWTQPSTPDTGYAPPDRGRIAQLLPGGMLRLLDLATGLVIGERSGLPNSVSRFAILMDDWLYLSGDDALWRLPVTGSEPATRLTDGGNLYARRCGHRVCVQGGNFVAGFDNRTGKQLWRKETKLSGLLRVSDGSVIVTLDNTDSVAAAGDPGRALALDGGQIVLNLDGRDITPENMGSRRAGWIDGETLLLLRDLGHVVASSQEVPPRDTELSVYSLATGDERSLGRQHLLGNCTGVPDRYVCASQDGFVLFRP